MPRAVGYIRNRDSGARERTSSTVPGTVNRQTDEIQRPRNNRSNATANAQEGCAQMMIGGAGGRAK